MIWTAFTQDFSKIMHNVYTPKHVTIPAGLTVAVNIDLEDAAIKKFQKNPVWLAKLQEKSKSRAVDAVQACVKLVKEMDDKAEHADEKECKEFAAKLTKEVEQHMEKVGKEMSADAVEALAYLKKSKEELKTFNYKCGVKIGIRSISIAAGAAAAGVSHGAVAPLAIISMARSSLGIAQQIVGLAIDSGKLATLIDMELKAFKVVLGQTFGDVGKLERVRKTGTETLLSILSGSAGFDIGSLQKCKEHIEAYRIKIRYIEAHMDKYAEKIDPMLKEIQELHKQAAGNAKLLPKVDKAEKELDKLLKTTIRVHNAVNQAWVTNRRFVEAFALLGKGVAEWTNYAGLAAGAAVDIGLAVGRPDTVASGVISALVAMAEGLTTAKL